MNAEITARTLEFSISDVEPIKHDFVYCDVVGLRVSYAHEEVISLTVLTIDQESKHLVSIAYRIDLQEMWEPWIRELIEEHRPAPVPSCPSCAAPADKSGCRIPEHRTGCPRSETSPF